MEVNYFGPLGMCRAFAPALARSKQSAIANVLSAGGLVAVPIMGGYSPSKFAARAMSTCLRAELAAQGTTVTALFVGSVDTRMASHVRGAKEKPETIAAAGLAAIRRGAEEVDTDLMRSRFVHRRSASRKRWRGDSRSSSVQPRSRPAADYAAVRLTSRANGARVWNASTLVIGAMMIAISESAEPMRSASS